MRRRHLRFLPSATLSFHRSLCPLLLLLLFWFVFDGHLYYLCSVQGGQPGFEIMLVTFVHTLKRV